MVLYGHRLAKEDLNMPNLVEDQHEEWAEVQERPHAEMRSTLTVDNTTLAIFSSESEFSSN